jgi:hypothetical protein
MVGGYYGTRNSLTSSNGSTSLGVTKFTAIIQYPEGTDFFFCSGAGSKNTLLKSCSF